MKNRMLILAVLLAVGTVWSAGAEAEGAQGSAGQPATLRGAGSGGQPASFQAGKTTANDVEQALGKPNSNKTDALGQQIACYQYALISPEAHTFIRMVGESAGDADLTCCFGFTPGGVLADTTSSVGQRGVGGSTGGNGSQPQKPSCPPALARFDKPVSTRIGNGGPPGDALPGVKAGR